MGSKLLLFNIIDPKFRFGGLLNLNNEQENNLKGVVVTSLINVACSAVAMQ
jgi:hypothetical protein